MSRIFILLCLLCSCKKEPSNFEVLEPFLGEYKAKGWVLYPDKDFNLKHTVILKRNGKYQLEIEGSPYDTKARIKSVSGGASSSTTAFFDYYFSLDFYNEKSGETLAFNSDTLIMGLSVNNINKYPSPIYFIKQ